MTTTKNLLVELLVEELPPKALKKLGEAFAHGLANSLRIQRLTTDATAITPFASPRRLGVLVTDVLAKAQDIPSFDKLMSAKIGFTPDGLPTNALRKKLAKLLGEMDSDGEVVDVALGQLVVQEEQIFFKATLSGQELQNVLQHALDKTIAELPIPKLMTYQRGDGWHNVQFVRPAHGLVALHGSEVVDVTALTLQSGRETRGHRFESRQERIAIESADSYAAQLRDIGAVIASFAERRAEIVRQLKAAAGGLTPIDDEALLDEVTALVERPNVLACQFEPEFLAVPQECLILTMKANQKYFPLLDAQDKLTNRFLVVSNISPADASAVTGGNERVVRPRLADAKFFFDQDRRKSLADRVPGLAKVVYHGKLGTQGDRVERVRAIAKAIAAQLSHVSAEDVDQAAQLAKADLLTDMVGEFPELQGIMGGYYARHDGLGDAVAFAIEDHYKPRFSGDELPRNEVGLVVALADKLETLVGLFGIGQLPTGDKDPFALRRHALGVVRILSDGLQSLPLRDVLLAASNPDIWPDSWSVGSMDASDPKAVDALVAEFVFDRLSGALREQGFSAQQVDAVLALKPQRLADITARLNAVREFEVLPEAASLAAANKRIGNILKKVDGPVEARYDSALLQAGAENDLALELVPVSRLADVRFHEGDYAASLKALAVLKTPVDAFFDGVMVNAEDPALRANRLGLLKTLHEAMNRVADLSRLAS